MPLPREAERRFWAFLLSGHPRALPGLVVSGAGVVLQRDVQPFVFCSRSVPVFDYLSSMTDPLNGLNFKFSQLSRRHRAVNTRVDGGRGANFLQEDPREADHGGRGKNAIVAERK